MSTTPGPASPDTPSPLVEPVDYTVHSRLPGVLGRPVARGMALYLMVAVVLGALTGLVWHACVDLTVYTVGADATATTTERGLTGIFASDAWFGLVGAVVSLFLGWLGWKWFGRTGPVVTALVLLATLLAGIACWKVGVWQGPGDFGQRISTARPGERVPIEFMLHTRISLLAWPFAGIIPVLLASSLGSDHELRPRGWVSARSRRSPQH